MNSFITNCKLLTDIEPQNDGNLEAMGVIMFRNAIGNLMYVMVYIKLDITQVMGVVSQFITNCGQSHQIAMKWIFHYLKGIMDFGLCFRKNIEGFKP